MGSAFSCSNNTVMKWNEETKNVLVTGASSGIGAELARKFAQQGAELALFGRGGGGHHNDDDGGGDDDDDHDEVLQEVCQQCMDLGSPNVEMYSVDFTDNHQIKSAVNDAIVSFGQFDVVILNAGRSQGCYFEEINDVDQIDDMFKCNVHGMINTLHYLLHAPSGGILMSSWSRIVVVGNVAGLLSLPYKTIYCASQFALVGFCNALRIELQDTYGIQNAPKICLLTFPELTSHGNNNNNNNNNNINNNNNTTKKRRSLHKHRMSFGAELPPAEQSSSPYYLNVAKLEQACSRAMTTIAKGERDFHLPPLLSFRAILYRLIPDMIDRFLLNLMKKTYTKPAIKGTYSDERS